MTFREADAFDKIIEVLSRLRKTDKKTRKPMTTQTIEYYFVMFSSANAGDFLMEDKGARLYHKIP